MAAVTPQVDQQVETSPNTRYIRYSSVLGKGAYKTVYKAFDTEEALEVAWNKLHVDRLNEHDLEKVSNEVSLLRQVNHKNIIHFYDTWRGQDSNGNQTINFITEQMMSGTLKEYLRKAKAIKLKVIRRWCANILDAIAYLHAQDPPIMHRDLKCDNIFINGHVGEVKIGDLGLSGVKEREKADSVIGTPEFMAPELYEESYTEKVDIYAFGMCLLEIVSMEYPYNECNNMAQIFKKVFSGEKPQSFTTLVDGDVKDVIEACLQREAWRPCAADLLRHPLFRDWERDDGTKSNLSLVKGSCEQVPVDTTTAQASRSMPIGTELIDWSDPLKRNVLVSMIEGEGAKDDHEISVVATKENGGFYIGLEIPIRDAIKRVEFTFDPFGDSAQHIAHEMVAEFDLGEEQLSVIQQEVDLQVRIAKEQREAASRNATPQAAAKQGEREPSARNKAMPRTSSNVSQTAAALEPLDSAQGAHVSSSAYSSITPAEDEQLSTRPAEHQSGHHQHLAHSEAQLDRSSQQQMADQVPNVSSGTEVIHYAEESSIAPSYKGEAHVEHVNIRSDGITDNHMPVEPAMHREITPPVDGQSAGDRGEHVYADSSQGMTVSTDDHIGAPTGEVSSHVGEQAFPSHPENTYETHNAEPIYRSTVPSEAAYPNQDTVASQGTDVHVSGHPRNNDFPVAEQEHRDLANGDIGTHAPDRAFENVRMVQDHGIHPAQHGHLQDHGERFTHGNLSQGAESEATVPHVQNIAIGNVPTPSQMPAPQEHSFPEHADQLAPLEDHHQALPHASSFMSSAAQSATSVETPSGFLSPQIPQEHHPMTSTLHPHTSSAALAKTVVPPTYQGGQSQQVQHGAGPGELVHSTTTETARDTTVSHPGGNVVHESGDMRDLTTTPGPEPISYNEPEESMQRHHSFPQEPRVLNARSSNPSIPRHHYPGNHFPQSVSEELLHSRRGSKMIDVPPRPPSTPITPASGRADFTEEQFHAPSPSTHSIGQHAASESISHTHSAVVQGENHVFSGQPTRELTYDRSRSQSTSRPRPKSTSRPAIVVVENDPPISVSDSSVRPTMERPPRGLAEHVIPEVLGQAHPNASDLSNNRVPFPEPPVPITGSAPQFDDFVRSEHSSSQQASPPGTDQPRTSSWMSLHSDETAGGAFMREAASSGVSTGKYDQEMYTLNLKLMDLCARGRYEEVISKLSQGASVKFSDYDSRTPLHVASADGHLNICSLLIEHGANVNAKDRWGLTPLFEAKEGRFQDVAELLVARGAVDVSSYSVEILSMELMQFVSRGDLHAVRQKIVAGALATFQDHDQRTPLHLACCEGFHEIAEVLLLNGASPSVRDRKGRSPVDDALSNGHRKILRVLKQYGATVPRYLFDIDPDLMIQRGMDLIEHSASGGVAFVEKLLKEGVDPRFADFDGRTPLHVACAAGNLEVVQVLLRAGADAHACDRWSSTPLEEARMAGFSAIVDELNAWSGHRSQKQVGSVSFDHGVVTNGHGVLFSANGENETIPFEEMSHGIATSVSLGAMPNIDFSPDDFVGEHPSSRAEGSSGVEGSAAVSISQISFDTAEDVDRTEHRSSEELLLYQNYLRRRQQLEEEHKRAKDQLRKKAAEHLAAEQQAQLATSVSRGEGHAPTPSRMPVPLQERAGHARSQANGTLLSHNVASNGQHSGHLPGQNSNPTNNLSFNTERSHENGSTSHMTSSASPMGAATMEEKGAETGENSAIRLLVDGLIEAAVR